MLPLIAALCFGFLRAQEPEIRLANWPAYLSRRITTRDIVSPKALRSFLSAHKHGLDLYSEIRIVPISGSKSDFVVLIRSSDGNNLLMQASSRGARQLAIGENYDAIPYPEFAAKDGSKIWIAGAGDFMSNAWQPWLCSYTGNKLVRIVTEDDETYAGSDGIGFSINGGKVSARFRTYSYPRNLDASHASADRRAILTITVDRRANVHFRSKGEVTRYNTLDNMAGSFREQEWKSIRSHCLNGNVYRAFCEAMKALGERPHIYDSRQLTLDAGDREFTFSFSHKHPAILAKVW